MQRLNGVIYDAEPEKVVVYPSCVDVTITCQEVEVKDEMSGETQTKYSCNIERYEVHEYIKKLQTGNSTMEQQLTDTQMALCDVYELITGGM